MKIILRLILFLAVGGAIAGFNLFTYTSQIPKVPIAFAIRQNLSVEVKIAGELEAVRSMTIASFIKGDQGKIIDIIPDGMYVQPGEVLVKLDPTPFEDKLEKLRIQVKENEAQFSALIQTLEWEKIQSEHKNKTAQLEVESARLELEKVIHGDGPQEIYKLKSAMQKALQKYEELNAYSSDLIELEKEGFLNSTEVKQAQKKLGEELEVYEIAKQQYESYVQHVFPMQVKKVETLLKRAQVAEDEMAKMGLYNIAKAEALLDQANQLLADSLNQIQDAENELKQTEIHAPAQGMVVLREEYRSGQKRKPRIGDILVKNQPLIDLPDLSSMMVKTRVREVDLFKVETGKKTSVEIDAYPQLAFNGTVKSIGVLALADIGRASEEKYFEVRISLDESDPRLRPGMTSRAIIHAQEANDVITIPLHSVFDERKEHYCYVFGPRNSYEKRNIVLGICNEQWVEVKSGLAEGECVCLLNPFN